MMNFGRAQYGILIFLSRLHQSHKCSHLQSLRRQEFHIWVWNVRRGCHYDGCFCLTFDLNNSLTLLELLTQTIITPWWDSLRNFPQEVCHKRTRLTTKFSHLKVIHWIKVSDFWMNLISVKSISFPILISFFTFL